LIPGKVDSPDEVATVAVETHFTENGGRTSFGGALVSPRALMKPRSTL
jgi:hypothetical protein